MIKIKIININKELIPYTFAININGVKYELQFHYNLEHDYFTVDLVYQNFILVEGEKLILNKKLFEDIETLPIPSGAIIPMDVSGQAHRVTFKNLNDSVFLYVFEVGENNAI